MRPHETIPWLPYAEMSDEERIAATRSFYDRIKNRRTCRFVGPGSVPRAAIEAALMAAGTAPSGANHQPWHFAVITSRDAKHQIRVAAEEEEKVFYSGRAGKAWLEALSPLGTDEDKSYLEIAPVLIAVFGQRKGGAYSGEMRQNYYVNESVGIACGLLLVALHEAGFATLTHTPNPMQFLNQICGRSSNEKPLMLIVVGHAMESATIPKHAIVKKPLDQISTWI